MATGIPMINVARPSIAAELDRITQEGDTDPEYESGFDKPPPYRSKCVENWCCDEIATLLEAS